MDIKKLLSEKAQVYLEIEGGRNPTKGFVVMNSIPMDKVDIVWHFNKLPWPIPDASIDILKADQVLQKVPRENHQFIKFMDEAWRVLKYDGQFMIAVPYMNSYFFYQDPLNVNPMNESTFAHFDPLEPIAGQYLYKVYKPLPWKINHMSFKIGGIMEVLLVKRRKDKSYYD